MLESPEIYGAEIGYTLLEEFIMQEKTEPSMKMIFLRSLLSREEKSSLERMNEENVINIGSEEKF